MTSYPSQVYVWEDFYFGIFSPGCYRNETKARITVFIALDRGSIEIEEDNGKRCRVQYAVVKRSQPVIISSDCDFITLQYFPLSMEYHSLNRFINDQSIREIEFNAELAQLSWISAARSGQADSSAFIKGCAQLLTSIAGYRSVSHKIDSRALYVAQRIRKELPDVSPITDYADELNISPDRLSHVFKDSLDVSIKNYVLLEKMRKALLLTVQGVPFTEASLQAGFADAAHFSRSTKKNFSLTPTTISNDIRVHVF